MLVQKEWAIESNCYYELMVVKKYEVMHEKFTIRIEQRSFMSADSKHKTKIYCKAVFKVKDNLLFNIILFN